MEQTFRRVKGVRHLYVREYETANGWTALYYGRFKCRLKNTRRTFTLGGDLAAAKDELKRKESLNVDKYDFDLDRKRVKATDAERDGKSQPFTFSEWADKFPTFDDVARKRSLNDDVRMIRLHLKPVFGSMKLTEISREDLSRYVDKRNLQTLIRGGKASKVKVNRGTISNELSCLRRMLRVALREGFKASVPSFEALIVRTERGGRELNADEQKKVMGVYDRWMARLAEFATETCLSEGDLLRVTEPMIDERAGVVKPDGGRKKTKVEQVAPLTARARAILLDIRADKKSGAIVPNAKGLLFTRDDGRPITKDMIQSQVEKAIKATGVKKFTFHNYRNTALTEWARRGINVDVAMKASGHGSVQMHKRYVDLQEHDVATAFGTAEMATGMATRKWQSTVSS
jgi:integrase